MTTAVLAPIRGRVHPLSDVPDPVFAGEMVGSGLAIEPDGDGSVTAVAPIAGLLLKLHPHAYVILGEGGVGVLVHIGIDTVRLKGAGFELHAAEKSRVAAGDPIVTFDAEAIRAQGLSCIVPVVVMDSAAHQVTPDTAVTVVDTGEVIYNWPPAA